MQSTATGSNYYLMKVEILSDYVQVGLCLFKKNVIFTLWQGMLNHWLKL